VVFLVSQAYLPLTGSSVFLARHLISLSLPLYLLVGRSLSLSGPVRQTLLLGALLALGVAAYAGNSLQEVKEDYRAAAGVVSANRSESDLLLFDPPYIELPFEYYYARGAGAGQPMQTLSDGLIAPSQTADAGGSLQSLVGVSRRVWLVTNPDNPARQSANSAVEQVLAGSRLTGEWRFRGVRLQSFEPEPGS
jgi:hypothetical protein